MKLIWYTVLIRAIPEAIGLTLLCLAIVKERRSIKDILVVSVICGVIAFTMRMLPLRFGIHIVLTAIVEAIIINYILKISLQKTFIGILISLAILAFGEVATFAFIQYVIKIDLQATYTNAIQTLLFGLPSIFMLYVAAWIIFKYNNRNISKEDVTDVN